MTLCFQRYCTMNPERSSIITQNKSYDTTSLRRSQARRNYSLSRANSVREARATTEERTMVRRSSLSRQSSFSDRSYTFGRSDATPTTYGGTFSRLGRPGYDYAAATRRSNLFDGYTGFAIYSSISQGLDEITYGGRRSRRNSITDSSYGYSASRRGSVSGNSSSDYAAMLAATAAVEAVNRAQDERISATSRSSHHKEESGIGTSPYLSRADSTRQSTSCQSDSACESSPSGTSKRAHQTTSVSKTLSPYTSSTTTVISNEVKRPSSILSRQDSLKQSKSSTKLERKVSFHSGSDDRPISKLDRVDSQRTTSAMSSINGDDSSKKKKHKEKDKDKETDKDKEARREERRKRKEKKKADKVAKEREMMLGLKGGESCGDLLNQVSEKLKLLEIEQKNEETKIESLPENDIAVKATVTLTNGNLNVNEERQPVEEIARPAPQEPVQQDEVVIRPKQSGDSGQKSQDKSGSKRNSLDSKTVQGLAQDLAAECAKAYALMENSLTKFSNDFGPFGMNPRGRVSKVGPQRPFRLRRQ